MKTTVENWKWTEVTPSIELYWNRKEVMDKVNHACLFPFPAQLYPPDKNLLFLTQATSEHSVERSASEKLTAICCLFIQMKISNRIESNVLIPATHQHFSILSGFPGFCSMISHCCAIQWMAEKHRAWIQLELDFRMVETTVTQDIKYCERLQQTDEDY